MDEKTHFEYIRKVGPLFGKLAHKNFYEREFQSFGVRFWPNEILFLQKWYMWFEGLVNEDIKPVTRQQECFLNYFKTIKSNPPSRHSRGYTQLKKTQKTLIKYYYLRNLSKKVFKDRILNHPDSIYHYAKNHIEFGAGTYLPSKFEGTYLEKKLYDSRNETKHPNRQSSV